MDECKIVTVGEDCHYRGGIVSVAYRYLNQYLKGGRKAWMGVHWEQLILMIEGLWRNEGQGASGQHVELFRFLQRSTISQHCTKPCHVYNMFFYCLIRLWQHCHCRYYTNLREYPSVIFCVSIIFLLSIFNKANSTIRNLCKAEWQSSKRLFFRT